MTEAYILGIAMTPLGKFPERSVKDLTRQAVEAALQDAGCALGDIEAAWFSNSRQGQMEGQNSIRGQCALRSLGLQGVPITNVENACASSSTGLRQAYAHVKAGLHDLVLVAGAEKMFFPDQKALMNSAFLGGLDVHLVDQTAATLRRLAGDEATTGQGSIFMDLYAAFARYHMRTYGLTERQIAHAASKNHGHSALNPLSQYREPMSVEAVLADRRIAWPLTRGMCAPLSDGAAAAVVGSAAALARIGAARAVRIRACELRSGLDRPAEDLDRHITRLAALAAYERAGIGPADIDLAEVHDASAFAEILQIENLGFCERGAGGIVTERGETTLGGRLPVNPSGGLVSKGHPIGATGVIQLHELVTQLRGEAGPRQVEGARLAIAENGGGFWGVEEAAAVCTILEAP